MINVLLLCGGGSSEHDISIKSASFIFEKLKLISEVVPYYVCIEKDGRRTDDKGNLCELRKAGELIKDNGNTSIPLHYAIPCIHGHPGETGDIQSLFDMMGLPYLGSSSEPSKICFNKVSTKLWLETYGICNTIYTFIDSVDEKSIEKANKFFDVHKNVYVKASHQGSSIGCYHVSSKDDLISSCKNALNYSPYVLIEKTMIGRELEIAVFEYEGKLQALGPGEIKSESGFYSFEEKYSKESKANALYEVNDLPQVIKNEMHAMAKEVFTKFKLKDLARVDFFLTSDHKLFINEINTFPGHTEISLFPMLLKQGGISYETYIKDRIISGHRNI